MNVSASVSHTGNRYLQMAAVVSVVLLTLAATVNYPGSKSLLLLFGVLAAAMTKAIFDCHGRFFTFFLFAFLTLGCWAKLVLHFLFDTKFIEPTGDFDHSAQAWDTALISLSIAFATLAACHWITTSKRSPIDLASVPLPSNRLLFPALWAAATLSILLLAFNYRYSILKVGTEPTLQLSSYIYVIFSFMVAWGNFILLATIGYWLVTQKKLQPETLFYILITEGALTAISMGSRAQMILHVAVPFVICFTHISNSNWSFTHRQWVRVIGTTASMFVISILLVSADRLQSFALAKPVIPHNDFAASTITPKAVEIQVLSADDGVLNELLSPQFFKITDAQPGFAAIQLPGLILPAAMWESWKVEHETLPLPAIPPEIPLAAPPTESVATTRWKGMLRELSKLVVDRWVGLEGVLTVTSIENRSFSLLKEAIREKPDKGTQAIYQRMSNAQYQDFENFTFMTIPGPIAILLYSGNNAILIAGLAFLFLAGIATEQIAVRLVGNLFTQATVGVALAYLLVQSNFPRVQFFFLIEIIGFLAGLYILKTILDLRLAKPYGKLSC